MKDMTSEERSSEDGMWVRSQGLQSSTPEVLMLAGIPEEGST